jgi:hypothetical protein
MPAPLSRLCPGGPELTPGKTYKQFASYLCENPGEVVLYTSGGISYGCVVLNWAPNEVVFQVPDNMGFTDAGSHAELRITRPDGVMVLSRTVRLVNPPDLVEVEDGPLPEAPNQAELGQTPVQTLLPMSI